jgi:mono/diheme cytochrome c family protein
MSMRKRTSTRKPAGRPARKQAGVVSSEPSPRPASLSAFAEDVEPTAADRLLPALLIGILGALLYWGDMYVMIHGADPMGKGGSFPEELYYPIESYAALEQMHPKTGGNLMEIGRVAYQKYCQACHQPSGLGQPGMFPPLAGSDWVLVDSPNRIIRIVLDGLTGPITVNGQVYNNVMVPWRETIQDDQEIAAVLTFIRNEWGNQAPEVSAEKVAEIREATQDRAGRPWTAEELLKIPLTD